MDNSVERNKRIEEIRDRLYDTPNRDVAYLLTEVSLLQVERDKAIEGLKKIAFYYTDYGQPLAVKILSELGVPHETT